MSRDFDKVNYQSMQITLYPTLYCLFGNTSCKFNQSSDETRSKAELII